MRLLVTALVSLATTATAQQTNVPGDLVTGETIVLFVITIKSQKSNDYICNNGRHKLFTNSLQHAFLKCSC